MMRRRELLKYLGAAGLAYDPAMQALASLAGAAASSASGSPIAGRIFLNQVGYLPRGQKLATILTASNSASVSWFRVRSLAKGAVVLEGKVGPGRQDAASGDTVGLADFSAAAAPGSYRIEIDGAESDPFLIAPDAYAAALRLTMRAFYGQRCGCDVDLGQGYKHPRCHVGGEYHRSSGKIGRVDNHGGWHDAGDYGRYVVNSGISTGTLLWAWELYPRVLRGLGLGIPESGGKTPDFLAEVRWNLEWMLSLQDVDGGVWHKQTSENFCAFIMPQDDHLTSYVIGTGSAPYKSTCATADLASVMAIAARCYGEFDAEFAQRCLMAARRAWSWATANPGVVFRNPAGVRTGDYGDAHCGDEVLWASAELWRTTGELVYERAFIAGLPVGSIDLKTPSFSNLMPMACWTYALSSRAGSGDVKARIVDATLRAGSFLAAQAAANGYGNTLAAGDYVWGSNGTAGNQSLLLLVANHFQPDARMFETALGNLHYILGRNCHGVSWVTGLGVRPFQHPHHRPSAADGIDAPWPGLVSGGPNGGAGDDVARALPKMPPMRRWVDDQRAYSLNEVAINWNAPLVFLLAAANS